MPANEALRDQKLSRLFDKSFSGPDSFLNNPFEALHGVSEDGRKDFSFLQTRWNMSDSLNTNADANETENAPQHSKQAISKLLNIDSKQIESIGETKTIDTHDNIFVQRPQIVIGDKVKVLEVKLADGETKEILVGEIPSTSNIVLGALATSQVAEVHRVHDETLETSKQNLTPMVIETSKASVLGNSNISTEGKLYVDITDTRGNKGELYSTNSFECVMANPEGRPIGRWKEKNMLLPKNLVKMMPFSRDALKIGDDGYESAKEKIAKGIQDQAYSGEDSLELPEDFNPFAGIELTNITQIGPRKFRALCQLR